MNSNIVRTWNNKTIRHRADGYLSLTDMAQACDKKVNDWIRLKDTQEYLETLSIDTELSIRTDETDIASRCGNSRNALIDIGRGGIPENQGTWGHELVALEFARWCNKSLSIQCNKWVKELLSTGNVSLVKNELALVPIKSENSKQSAKETCELIDAILSGVNLDPFLVAGLKANEVSKEFPEFKPLTEATKKLLPLPVESELLRATDLAEQLTQATGISFNARSVNKFLLEHQFQIKNPQNEPPYLPTEKGEQFAKVVLQEANGNNKTVQQLRWFSGIVDSLKSLVGGL